MLYLPELLKFYSPFFLLLEVNILMVIAVLLLQTKTLNLTAVSTLIKRSLS